MKIFSFIKNSQHSKYRCNVCFSTRIKKVTYTYTGLNNTVFKLRKPTLSFIQCLDCDYCFCQENYRDDCKYLHLGNSHPGCIERIGDGETILGREYYMARNAFTILGKKDAEILIFGPGFNKDHISIRKHSYVSECKITDLKNFQNSDHFITMDTKETFDVVVACEVVEHFSRPREEFTRLFSYLKKDGLLIFCTNIRRDKDISKCLYPFLSGHMSYYSGASLIHIAKMKGMYIDFRRPAGEEWLGPTKRYIYMTKNKENTFAMAKYFSVVCRPPSEYAH
jgi:hypothetical protein